jgi:hypothetical protein
VNNGRFFTVMPMLQWSVWLLIGLMVSSVRGACGQDVTGGSPGQVIVTQRAIRHVEERHWPDSLAQGAGKFSPGITEESFRQLVGEAVSNGRVRQNSHGRPGQIYEYDFGHPIGVNIDGRPAYRLRVVVNQRSQLITAFPF